MNYDQARQTADGVWYWTTMNDGRVRTAAPCIQYELERDPGYPEGHLPGYLLGQRIKEGTVTRCDHKTREEAEQHFYDYSLEEAKESASTRWLDCAVCGAPTKRLLDNAGFWLTFNKTPLCDEHFNKDTLRELHPFAPGVQLMHS